jgi:hypothetical protein
METLRHASKRWIQESNLQENKFVWRRELLVAKMLQKFPSKDIKTAVWSRMM